MQPSNVVAATEVGETFLLTAGDSGGQIGYRSSGPVYGSIDPASPPALHFGTFTMSGVFSQGSLFLEYEPTNIPDTDASWRQCRVTGTFSVGTGSAVYLRADRTSYDPSIFAVATRWTFALNALGEFVSGNVYSCNVQR